MSLLQYTFESQYLSGNTTVTILLPDKPQGMSPAEFYGSGQKYKVLWLLHGTCGDSMDWIRRTNIELYTEGLGLVVTTTFTESVARQASMILIEPITLVS